MSPAIQPARQEDFANVYTMYYRQHTNHLVSKNFRFKGTLREARERAEKHCNIIGAKLNFVQAFISDLALEERYSLGHKIESENVASASDSK